MNSMLSFRGYRGQGALWLKISDAVEFDPQSGTSYCSAWVEFDATELTDGKNKSVPLKSGLVCTVKIITDRMRVLPYVWEKIR